MVKKTKKMKGIAVEKASKFKDGKIKKKKAVDATGLNPKPALEAKTKAENLVTTGAAVPPFAGQQTTSSTKAKSRKKNKEKQKKNHKKPSEGAKQEPTKQKDISTNVAESKGLGSEVKRKANGQEATVSPKQPKVKTKPRLSKAAKKLLSKNSSIATDGNKIVKDYTRNAAQTVFVGNLPTNTNGRKLKRLFAPYGPIVGIRLRTAGGKTIFKSKMRKECPSLNAFVILKQEEMAVKALELNGAEFGENHIRVTKVKNEDLEIDAKRTIAVGNLKYSATDEQVHQMFSTCGEIQYVRILRAKGEERCNGVAFVCFKNPEAIGLALELNGTLVDDRAIRVSRYSSEGTKRKEEKNNTGKIKGSKQTNGAKAAKKKSEFRGVKSDITKKKEKLRQKLPKSMKKLAKKIAHKDDK